MAPDSTTSFEVGRFVAYSDTDDPADANSKRFHLGKCVNVADGVARVHCYATHDNALSRAKWSPLFQNAKGIYATDDSKHGNAVTDEIPVDSDGYVHHYNVQLRPDGKISLKSRRQLAALGVSRHRLGHTYP